ncbi:MAG: manganese efflux pump, partial [Clostridia bacterium]|nr:manganese efflux pump [Clostridia bacterium]
KLNLKQGIFIAFMFGLFQCLMPIIGYFFCRPFEGYIKGFDHWIIFILLSFIGAKMIIDCIKELKGSNKNQDINLNTKNEENSLKRDNLKQKVNTDKQVAIVEKTADNQKFSFAEIVTLALATSIDALAVGITFAMVETSIFTSCLIIGIVTLILCFAGVIIGNYFGSKIKSVAEILGGCILILIGLKILLEHMGVLVF